MKKKIKFNQPKYILPLIMLPFVFGGYFLVYGADGTTQTKSAADSTVAGINMSFPTVDTTVSNQALTDKFKAYQAAFDNAREKTAMEGIYQDENGKMAYQSIYSDEEINQREAQRIIDSINRKYGSTGAYINNEFDRNSSGRSSRTVSANSDMEDFLKMQNEINAMYNKQPERNGGNVGGSQNTAVDEYEQQMKLFREQMRMVDSLQQGKGDPSMATTATSGMNNKGVRYQFTQDTSFKPVSVEAVGNKNIEGFNTIRNSTKNAGKIMAMIDQDVKATAGSRVRIRLLSEMFAGDALIPAGTYVYGFVSGFQTQRVNISVKYIQLGEQSIPVQLDLFDNDGYVGLYVPGSNFREFTKEIGSQASQGMSSMIMPDGSNVVSNLLSQIFNSTTTTAANLIRKNKANLKYNYIVYLRDGSRNK